MAAPPRGHNRLCDDCYAKLMAVLDHGCVYSVDEKTTTPEDTLREAGISGKRQAKYQRRMSGLLAGRT
jgi:hypothetical protein